ncbi:MAG: pyrroloquinoline quinone biosynthesis peptide chaperone PqqD [Planctomycetaceae bacterium]|nr:pyrroloquinoline quinone biosynthesis peptide chaperone PqqD [Planctomycetaceae bacterium]
MSQSAKGSSMEPSLRPRLATRTRLRSDEVGGGSVLLYPEGLLALNATAAAILEQCDARRTLAEVVATLADRHGAPADVVACDVVEFLGRLHARGLVALEQGGSPS